MDNLDRTQLRIKLFEGIDKTALDNFMTNWFTNINVSSESFDGERLKKEISWAEIIWIRSRTKLAAKDILENADKLLAIGCFCIWTNQVDVDEAKKMWIPVFNSPFSNTRSVAELVIWEVIMLMRGIFKKSLDAHDWIWAKTAKNSFEIKWKTIWIVWYWHIWTQVSILAEAFWMSVVFYDVANKLPLWSAKKMNSLQELLNISDIVTLHVPSLPTTANLIWKKEFDAMKNWTYLLNLSRWNVVDINELKANLDSGKVLGAAIDVFPTEPKSNNDKFESVLQGDYNVILTPHVGWSTQEAQRNIWSEVSDYLLRYILNWDTVWSVNFPQIAIQEKNENSFKIQHIHKNIPWVLAEINKIFANDDINILFEYLKTEDELGYLIFDIDKLWEETLAKLRNVKWTIKTRAI